ncbi:MAG TPA: nucleotidyltransferase family protein [Candidatus Sulfopaludibacter sp.]|jgi:dTDP-glucose pyrophosphorylase|nr:nucleotidyltransferase family protein [Candidatus Sulfopaludibacter sp.]
MWGIIPAAGKGSRIQPLAFSKELLPVGARGEGEQRRPRAVSDYLVERLVKGGATRICFVISPTKSDILGYYGGGAHGVPICYCVQPEPLGLCDAIFRALPVIDEREPVLVGLPDTVWFPEEGLRTLPNDRLSFLLFPVQRPQFFDAVTLDREGRVTQIQVKHPAPSSHWIWGAFKMPGVIFHDLHKLWLRRGDEYMGTLVNAWLAEGGEAWGVCTGTSYLDVGAMEGYLTAMRTLADRGAEPAASEVAL